MNLSNHRIQLVYQTWDFLAGLAHDANLPKDVWSVPDSGLTTTGADFCRSRLAEILSRGTRCQSARLRHREGEPEHRERAANRVRRQAVQATVRGWRGNPDRVLT